MCRPEHQPSRDLHHNLGRVPTVISAWDSDLVGNRIIQTTCLERKFATQTDKMALRDSREMSYDSKLQNMSWFCYNLWTRCPGQAWPRSSLIIKHYRVQVGNHHRGYWSPCISLALKKELLFLEQINQWLGVLRNSYGTKMISLTDHRILHTCITDLGWYHRKQNKPFSNSWRQLTSNACELGENHSFHPNIYLMSGTRR